MECELQVLDPTGHVTVLWNPDDSESVDRAKAEFERLKEAGFAFFTSATEESPVEAEELIPNGLADARLQPTRKFRRRSKRTVAVAPMRGG